VAEKRKGLLERLKTRKTLILREPLSARLERKVHGSTRGETEKTYYVRYIDLATGKTMEKTIADIEQYDLYKQQREGEISIIEIHRVKGSPVEIEESSSLDEASTQKKSTSELAEAKKLLKVYSERVGCSWCRRKASEIAGLIEKLESLTPLASQFAEQVGSLEAENIQRLNEEIRQVTNQDCPTCKIKR